MAGDELPVLEFGRYKLRQTPDQGILISRATGTCETCQACGCGSQAEPVPIPGVVAKVLTGQHVEFSELAGLLGQMPPGALLPRFMKGMFGRGRNGSKPGDGVADAESSDPAGSDLAGLLAAGLPGEEIGSESGDGGEGPAGTV